MAEQSGSRDMNQDAADAVRQRGWEATVDIGEEPSGEPSKTGAVEQEAGKPKEFSGDVRDTVNDDVEEPEQEP